MSSDSFFIANKGDGKKKEYTKKSVSARNLRRADKRLKDDLDSGSDSDVEGNLKMSKENASLNSFKAQKLSKIAGGPSEGPVNSIRNRMPSSLEDHGLNLDKNGNNDEDDDDEEDDFLETPAQKRMRLAKEYISAIREETKLENGDVDAAYLDKQIIADRLKNDNLENHGKLFKKVAEKYLNVELNEENGSVQTIKSWKKPHQLSLTSVAVAILPLDTDGEISSSPLANVNLGNDDTFNSSIKSKIFIYTASKDATIAKWDFDTGKLIHYTPGGLKPTKKAKKTYGSKLDKQLVGHNEPILALACSTNGRYLASGGFDKGIHVWDTISDEHIKVFNQHRDAVSGLVFKKDYNKNDLYSASFDRTIKVWSIDALTYVETLFGHQDKISSISALQRERCITSGSQDRTARIWKIPEESQLVFRGSGAQQSASEELVVMDGQRKKIKENYGKQEKNTGQNIDAVVMVDDETFITGGDNGSIALWSTTRKKPIYIKAKCHGPGSLIEPLTVNNANPKTLGEYFEDREEDKQTDDNKKNFNRKYEKLSLATRGCSTGQNIPTSVISLASLPSTDLFVSGGADGYVRVWKISDDKKKFGLLTVVKIDGFINQLVIFESQPQNINGQENSTNKNEITKNNLTNRTAIEKLAIRNAMMHKKNKQKFILAAVGQEHKFGRWWKRNPAKNCLKLIKLDHQSI